MNSYFSQQRKTTFYLALCNSWTEDMDGIFRAYVVWNDMIKNKYFLLNFAIKLKVKCMTLNLLIWGGGSVLELLNKVYFLFALLTHIHSGILSCEKF